MSDELFFAAEDENVEQTGAESLSKWKILVVDDEEEVHSITTLVLKNFKYDGRGLEFLHAYSGREAKRLIEENPDTAVVFLDVVMEKDDAGLEVVKFIRKELANDFVRIVLRTGQPGQAPEEQIIVEYDINDYKEKTELSSQKLFTVMVASLRTYQHMMMIEANRKGLEKIIDASASLFEQRSIKGLAASILGQLISLVGVSLDAFICQTGSATGDLACNDMRVLAGCGMYGDLACLPDCERLSDQIRADVLLAVKSRSGFTVADRYICFFDSELGVAILLYCEGWQKLDSMNKALVEIYCTNVQIAFENVVLNQEIEDTQKDIIITLGEIADARSHETGAHVQRVSEICRIIAEKSGMAENDVELLQLASPMHDIGKIAIPDGILNFPGKLTDEDFATMKDHAHLGSEMLASSPRKVMQVAALIAEQHHEKYDGTGYPKGLQKDEIHVFARIVALADVFDALTNDRVYRKAFEPEMVIEYITDNKGKHFDPQFVDIFLENIKEIMQVG
jgi:response regulator RpfG family c-di-GMP phosphodiesterase